MVSTIFLQYTGSTENFTKEEGGGFRMDATHSGSPRNGKPLVDPTWRGLYVLGAVGALTMFGFMIVQIIVFVIWPPPSDPVGLLTLFGNNWFLGLLSMDLLYIVDSVLLICIYLAIHMTLKDTSPSAMLVATVLGIIGVGAYFSSNTAFEMLSLGRQYARTTQPDQQVLLVSAAIGMFETYTGTAFDIYYVLNTLVLFVYFFVMRKAGIYGKAIPILSLVAGLLMVVPSSAGMLGMIFSLASLIPWAVWLILVSRKLLSFR